MHDHRRFARALRALLVVLVVAAASRARAQDDEEIDHTPLRPNERVEFSLENGDLGDLVRMITRVTGRQFLITGNLREVHATVMSSSPITAIEAYRAFLAILHQNGLTVVRRGRHYTVELSEHAAHSPLPVLDDDDTLPIDERFVTWIHHVSHVPVADASQLLEALRSQDGQLITYAPTQSLILVDTGANIRRMQRILDEVDVARGDAHVWVEPIHFGDAATIAEQLTALFAPTDAPVQPSARPPAERPAENGARAVGAPGETALYRVIPEPRTNALILVATPSGFRQVIAILREIDRPGGAEATVRVHRLQHGDATNIAATLTTLLGGAPAEGAHATAIAGLRGRVQVAAHADLNALVITAAPGDYNAIRDLIADLDAPPRQVFLEMVFMELSVDHGNDVGANVLSGLANLIGPGTVGILGAGGVAPAATELFTGISLAINGPEVVDSRLPGGSAPSFGVLVHALSRSNQANILSTPSILVLDNRQAVINVGQNVPVQGSSVPGIPSIFPGLSQTQVDPTQLANAAQQQQSAGRRDTGTIVHVTPHINDDGDIRLEIEAEDSRAGEVAAGNLGAVAFNQSIAQTELVLHDGETVVIGGLMRDSEEMRREGVPLLSEIPVLGALFGSTQRHTVRRNLLFFVTPYLVRAPSDMRAIYERRMRERREFMDRNMVFEGDWEPPVDYSRTRGLVSEMLDTVIAVDERVEAARVATPDPEHNPDRAPVDLD